MTVLIGKLDKKNKRVIMGCDSIATGHMEQYVLRKGKFAHFANGMVVGVTGDLDVLSHLNHCDIIPELDILKGTDVDSKWLACVFCPALSKALKSTVECLPMASARETVFSYELLVGYQDKLWIVTDTHGVYQVGEDFEDDFITLGCGKFAASGGMQIPIVVDPATQVLYALFSASTNNAYCKPPIILTMPGDGVLHRYDELGKKPKVIKL